MPKQKPARRLPKFNYRKSLEPDPKMQPLRNLEGHAADVLEELNRHHILEAAAKSPYAGKEFDQIPREFKEWHQLTGSMIKRISIRNKQIPTEVLDRLRTKWRIPEWQFKIRFGTARINLKAWHRFEK